jgi:hypothetical protein
VTASGLPLGATFIDNGDSTGTLRWLPAADQVGRYSVTFVANDGQGTDQATSRILAVVANDTFENATAISALPFTDDIPNLVATEELDDPPCVIGETVWYAFAASEARDLDVSNAGSDQNTYLGVYTGGRGALVEVACGFVSTQFHAEAGATYYVVLGSSEGGRLAFSASAATCDDGNACTTDSGTPATGCIHMSANLDATDYSAARVDGRDLTVLANAWNSCPGDLKYDAAANLDQVATAPGSCIDQSDFHLFMNAFGLSCP